MVDAVAAAEAVVAVDAVVVVEAAEDAETGSFRQCKIFFKASKNPQKRVDLKKITWRDSQ